MIRAITRTASLWLLAAIGLLAGTASAQGLQPGDQPLDPPSPPVSEESPPELTLPPLPEPAKDERDRLGAGLRLRVQRFEIVGSTVYDEDELRVLVAPFTGRMIGSEELIEARDAVTRHYIADGYVTSGAVLPDQMPVDGTVRLEIVEGRLAEVEIEGTRRIRDTYFRSRLVRAGRAPLRIENLENQIRLLQQNERIERIAAELVPADVQGESKLILRVTEGRMYDLAIAGLNDRSPAVGSGGGRIDATISNLIGFDDNLTVWGQFTSGLRDVYVGYEAAVTPWDDRLRFSYRYTNSEVVEEPFDVLSITNETSTLSLALRHPIYRSDKTEIWAGLMFERRTSESEILGFPICFEISSFACEEVVVSVIRMGAEWTRRTPRNVLAARGMLSVGFDGLGSTVVSGDDPDSKYVAFLLQTQWLHVMSERFRSTHVVARAEGQVANDRLLAIEQFGVGGVRTVRGYRQNQLVRDNGAMLSLEARIPVWRDEFKRHRLEIIPFIDFGHVWNDGVELPGTINTIASVGLGARLTPTPGISMEIFWGHRLKIVPNPEQALQDYGVNLRVSLYVP